MQDAQYCCAWDGAIENIEAPKSTAERLSFEEYLRLDHRNDGATLCGKFNSVFLVSRHPKRKIKAEIRCIAWYAGKPIDDCIRWVPVGPKSSTRLGCEGFDNTSGGFDTTYEREIISAVWDD